jgi:hypothetical protein
MDNGLTDERKKKELKIYIFLKIPLALGFEYITTSEGRQTSKNASETPNRAYSETWAGSFVILG